MIWLIIIAVGLALGGIYYWAFRLPKLPVPDVVDALPKVPIDDGAHFWRDAKTGKRLTAKEAAKRNPATVVRERTAWKDKK